jgi:hypothetical protein
LLEERKGKSENPAWTAAWMPCRNPPSKADYGISLLRKHHLSACGGQVWNHRHPCRFSACGGEADFANGKLQRHNPAWTPDYGAWWRKDRA